jgi:5-methyltetrahydrofolate--homocysteine methyltransferase
MGASRADILDRLRRRGLLFDGAMGSLLEAGRDRLPAFDCPERLVLEAPAEITDIHRQYLAAGAEAVETCTFGATPHKLSLHGLEEEAAEINRAAAAQAREAAREFPGALVAGSLGPTGLLSIEKRTDFQDFYRNFSVQAVALLEGGVDLLLVETGNDMMELRAAVLACRDAMATVRREVLLAVSLSVDEAGRLLLGTSLPAAVLALDHLGVDVLGVNCSLGPEGLLAVGAALPALVSTPLLAMPNRGLPRNVGGHAVYDMPEDEYAAKTAAFLDHGFQAIGGCCGTTPECIRRLRERMDAAGRRPQPVRRSRTPALTGIFEALLLGDAVKPVIVGERLNYHGSKKFRTAVDSGDLDAVMAIARDQVDRGAGVLDLCLSTRDLPRQLDLIRRITPLISVNAARPLMIDTTEPEAMTEACRRLHGRGVINSCNLEDPAKCRDILALARRHGQMVVCLPVAGGTVPREPAERLANALKIYQIAAEVGLYPHDLIFDPLILTLATGRPEDRDNGLLALRTLDLFKKHMPGAFAIMGVSNVSYGLPAPIRPVLNNVLLWEAARRGLDFAIFNPAELRREQELPPDLRELAEDLLLNRREDALERILELGRRGSGPEPPAAAPARDLPPAERLKAMIVQRERAGFLDTLARALEDATPQELIQTVFLPAMAEVGGLMDTARLPLPYVLESASMTQEGLQYLRRHFAFEEAGGRGRVVLATVRGDVHDIGKNLVRMLLVHNGYDVTDLGTDVSAEQILRSCRETRVDVVGLSALLVSTSREMRRTVALLQAEGLDVPVLIGGAAVNHAYALELAGGEDGGYAGGVFYAKDAFQGLKTVTALVDPEQRRRLQAEARTESRAAGVAEAVAEAVPAAAGTGVPVPRPAPPYLDEVVRTFCVGPGRLIRDFNFEKQCGRKLLAQGRVEDGFYRSLMQTGEQLLGSLVSQSLVAPLAVFGLFPVHPGDDGLAVHHAGQCERISLDPACWKRLFRRGDEAFLPLLVVTLGGDLHDRVRRHFDEGDYLQGYILSTIGAELADELAEVATSLILEELGLERRRVVRYSPGYPVWRNLADQRVLFHLLGAEARIGVHLSEACQMIPEFSVSAGLLFKETDEPS